MCVRSAGLVGRRCGATQRHTHAPKWTCAWPDARERNATHSLTTTRGVDNHSHHAPTCITSHSKIEYKAERKAHLAEHCVDITLRGVMWDGRGVNALKSSSERKVSYVRTLSSDSSARDATSMVFSWWRVDDAMCWPRVTPYRP
jgi:hypothetical protein